MRKRIFDLCGISVFDLNMLLDMKPEDEFKDWRDTILSQLELYVVKHDISVHGNHSNSTIPRTHNTAS